MDAARALCLLSSYSFHEKGNMMFSIFTIERALKIVLLVMNTGENTGDDCIVFCWIGCMCSSVTMGWLTLYCTIDINHR